MNPQLEYLRQLQEIDVLLKHAEKEIAHIPKELEKAKHHYLKEEEIWESKKKEHTEIEKEKREKERDLAALEAKLVKYNTQALSVKTNQEYTALLHETDLTKKEISGLEEEIINFLDKIEENENFLTENKHKIEKSKKTFEDEKKRVEKKLDELNKERESLLLKRKEMEAMIESDLHAEYQKIYRARKNIAVTRAKDGMCTGCNMMLMPQLFQEIITMQEKIYRCPNCHRMLFYSKENAEN